MSKEEMRELVAHFLRQCNAYARGELERYSTQEAPNTMEQLMLQEKITRWSTYLAFNDYAIEELAAGELDAWLQFPVNAKNG
jgi:hypothetical protein